jgi:hypothetical protein
VFEADERAALAELQAQPHHYSLFAALRLLEQVFADSPRLGEARKAADDLVRLGHAPHLSFAPCDVAQLEHAENGAVLLEQFAFGLFGPNGALPLHLTELAYERRRHKEDATVVDFLGGWEELTTRADEAEQRDRAAQHTPPDPRRRPGGLRRGLLGDRDDVAHDWPARTLGSSSA